MLSEHIPWLFPLLPLVLTLGAWIKVYSTRHRQFPPSVALVALGITSLNAALAYGMFGLLQIQASGSTAGLARPFDQQFWFVPVLGSHWDDRGFGCDEAGDFAVVGIRGGDCFVAAAVSRSRGGFHVLSGALMLNIAIALIDRSVWSHHARERVKRRIANVLVVALLSSSAAIVRISSLGASDSDNGRHVLKFEQSRR